MSESKITWEAITVTRKLNCRLYFIVMTDIKKRAHSKRTYEGIGGSAVKVGAVVVVAMVAAAASSAGRNDDQREASAKSFAEIYLTR